jgi:hypothetical protein
MLGIPLYSYLYPRVTKMICLIFSYVFSSTKSKKQVELKGVEALGSGSTMCINVSKCKNNKIKVEKKRQRSGGSQ